MSKYRRRQYATFLAIGLAFCLASLFALILYFHNLKPIPHIKDYKPTLLSQIVSNDGQIIKTYGAYKYKELTVYRIPVNFKNALVATEDQNFYKHHGFDVIALTRSVLSNLKARRFAQGASTITQQLSRILFLSSEKTITRKLKELIIATKLEKSLTKNEILQMYTNNVYLGEGSYGLSAAAEIYFNKTIDELTLAESAMLAGMPQAPSRYTPFKNMKLAIARRNKVLRRMYHEKYITKKQYESACDEEIVLNPEHRTHSLNKAPYFVDFIMRTLEEKTGLTEQEFTQGGYKIYTTLNYKLHKEAEDQIKINMDAWKLVHNEQVALVSMDVITGKILAYIGGRNYQESQFDRATQSVRQPGSSFKIFVYTKAMENGYTPFTYFDDEPFVYGDWTPKNYGHVYRGRMPLYKALAYSSNVVAARLIKEVGVKETTEIARRLGITTPMAKDPTIVLGSSGVKLMEMTNAYGTIANGGIKVKPYAVERVETSSGEIIYQAEPSYKRVLDTKVAAYMVEMLKQVVQHGTARASKIGRPSGGKTGTTDCYKDAWFLGFTPEIVTGVWLGKDDCTSLGRLTGGSLPAVIWREFMKKAEADKPISQFVYPDIVFEDGFNLDFSHIVDEDEDFENELLNEANYTFDDKKTKSKIKKFNKKKYKKVNYKKEIQVLPKPVKDNDNNTNIVEPINLVSPSYNPFLKQNPNQIKIYPRLPIQKKQDNYGTMAPPIPGY